jgi:hypothetical protein
VEFDSSFIIHHSSFIIHHSSFIIHHSSFIIHPFRRRPPTVLAMGQNRQKPGNTCLLPPSTSSGRMGPE